MITKPVPAPLGAPTGHTPTNRTTPELATALAAMAVSAHPVGAGTGSAPEPASIRRRHKARAEVDRLHRLVRDQTIIDNASARRLLPVSQRQMHDRQLALFSGELDRQVRRYEGGKAVWRRVIGVALICGVAAAVATIAPSAATASSSLSGDARCATAVKIRTGPHRSNTALGVCETGDGVIVHDSTNGDLITCDSGIQSWIWNNITDLRTGVTGWVSGCYLAE
jgi:hypothetical protein